MTNVWLCRVLVVRALSKHAPGYARCFIGQSHAGPVFSPSRRQFYDPGIFSVFRRMPGNKSVKHRPRPVDQQGSGITIAVFGDAQKPDFTAS